MQAPERLLDRDHSATTVLMHAAGAGRSAVFTVILDELQRCYKDYVSPDIMNASPSGQYETTQRRGKAVTVGYGKWDKLISRKTPILGKWNCFRQVTATPGAPTTLGGR